MPLKSGKSKKVLTYNISEMMRSPTFAAGKSRKKKQSMAVAASYAQARKSGATLPRKRNPKKKKPFPSIGTAIQAKRKHKKQLEEALEY
jgi:hypothetical protein